MNAYRGEFDFPETLRNAIPVAESGDYALIRKTRTIWVYSSSGWSDTETPEGILDRSIPSGGFKNQVLTKNDDNVDYSVEWAYITIASKFTDLTDTPESYVGQASKFLAVKSDLSGIEFVSPSGAGDMLASVYDPTGKNADAFNVDNHVSGSTNKVFTATEKTKLSGIASGAEVNVNADWNSSSGDSQILNKPTILSISGLSKITVGATEPSNPSTGDLWVDTN